MKWVSMRCISWKLHCVFYQCWRLEAALFKFLPAVSVLEMNVRTFFLVQFTGTEDITLLPFRHVQLKYDQMNLTHAVQSIKTAGGTARRIKKAYWLSIMLHFIRVTANVSQNNLQLLSRNACHSLSVCSLYNIYFLSCFLYLKVLW